MESATCYFCFSPRSTILFRDPISECAIAKCERCGAIYTKERWTEERIKTVYAEDEVYASGRSGSWSEKYLPSQVNELKEIESRFGKIGSILDVGCGGGAFVYTAKELGWDAMGVDMSEAGIRHARSAWGLSKEVQVIDFDDLELRRKFDVITMFHVLEHVYEPHKLLKRLKAMLTSDGLLVIAVPNFGSRDVRDDPNVFNHIAALPYHSVHFTPSSLTHLLEQHQILVEEIRLHPSQWILRMLGRNPGTIVPENIPMEVTEIERREYIDVRKIQNVRQNYLKSLVLRILSKISPGVYMVAYGRMS